MFDGRAGTTAPPLRPEVGRRSWAPRLVCGRTERAEGQDSCAPAIKRASISVSQDGGRLDARYDPHGGAGHAGEPGRWLGRPASRRAKIASRAREASAPINPRNAQGVGAPVPTTFLPSGPKAQGGGIPEATRCFRRTRRSRPAGASLALGTECLAVPSAAALAARVGVAGGAMPIGHPITQSTGMMWRHCER